MNRIYALVFFILVIGCNSRKGDIITRPEIDENFYLRSVSMIEEEIQENPDDTRFIRLQLSYYEKLGWPVEAEDAIDRAVPLLALDPIFINQQIDFYRINGKTEKLLELIDELELMGEISDELMRTKLRIRIALNDTQRLRNDLKSYPIPESLEDHLMLAQGYLKLGDTTIALDELVMTLQYGTLNTSQIGPFLPVLENAPDKTIATAFLNDIFNSNSESASIRTTLSKLYYETGDTVNAKITLLAEGMEREHLIIAADWYSAVRRWDSSMFFLNTILIADSTDQQALMMAGNLNQDRGFFNTSLRFYQRILRNDSTNQEVLDQIDLVSRKIAYLQKIREAQQDIPVLELNAKKANQN